MVPEDLLYTAEHEWIRSTSANTVTFGITHYAQDALGDIVFVDLPRVGQVVSAGTPCGEVESTKSVSEIYAPVSGEVVAVNVALSDAPEIVNAAPYGDGWLVEVLVTGETSPTLDSIGYRGLIGDA